ncbi:metal ABC transporter substrate-binding protein [Pseudochelatococcus sp. G4_1912]|uniref:metal ABC transporter substrate-binding protein n=1 Tax=Pseudochelatococcus sp. G4_1912 TaxID=3114288 RepID=UPI0039C5CD90
MFNRRFVLATLMGLPLAMSALPLSANAHEDPIKVVASFSIVGDMVKEIGGNHVDVTTLVGPDGDAHVYEPTPADAKKLGEAKVLFENGLTFESWLPRLVDASGFKGIRVVVSDGIKPRAFAHKHDHHDHTNGDHEHHDHAAHDHGPNDPHAWQNVANAVIYANNIATALEKLDPEHAPFYKTRASAYVTKLEMLDAKLKATFAAIPEAQRKVVSSHDAFGYFGDAYGITFIAPEGVSTETEASAADVARIIDQIREDKITAVFVENITSTKLTEQIARATNAKIGGRLYSDALAKTGEPAATYIGMIEWNANQLARALAP